MRYSCFLGQVKNGPGKCLLFEPIGTDKDGEAVNLVDVHRNGKSKDH